MERKMNKVDIPENIIKISKHKGEQLSDLLSTPLPEKIEVGQIWSTHQNFEITNKKFFTEDPRLLVILEVHQDCSLLVKAAPVSVEIQFASQYDLKISKHDSPMGFEFMVEVWNETPVYEKHLKQVLGKLSSDATQVMLKIYSLQLVNDPVPENIQDWVGLKMFCKEDPRITFQEDEVLALSYITRAATYYLNQSLSLLEQADDEKQEAEFEFRVKTIFSELNNFRQLVSRDWALASSKEESKTHLVVSPDNGNFFIFEIQEGLPSSNELFLLAHHIAKDLEDRKCFIRMIFDRSSYAFPSFILSQEIEVKTLVDSDFDILAISEVEVRIG